MDNAKAELLGNEASAGGVLMWMFEILQQPLTEKQRPMAMYSRCLPPIPSTVLFSYSRAQAWYDCVAVNDDDEIKEDSDAFAGGGRGRSSNRKPSSATLRRSESRRSTQQHPDISSESSDAFAICRTLTTTSTMDNFTPPPVSSSPGAKLGGRHSSSSPTARNNKTKTSSSRCQPKQCPPYFEYRRRKTSSLTTHNIVSVMCPSYLDVCQKLQTNEEQKGNRVIQISATMGLPSSMLSVITTLLPIGDLAAQVIRKAPMIADSSLPDSPGYLNTEDDVDIGDLSRRGEITAILGKVMQQSVQAASGTEAAVEFFDESELGRMMFHGTVTHGLLQEFHHPPRTHKHEPGTNDAIIANWQPHFCHVSRRRGRLPLTDGRIPSQVRGDTWDPRVSEYAAAPGSKLQQSICEACNAIVERVFLSCGGIRLRKLSVVFKLNAKGRIMLQWCQAASVVTSPLHIEYRDELIARLPFANSYNPPVSALDRRRSIRKQQQQHDDSPFHRSSSVATTTNLRHHSASSPLVAQRPSSASLSHTSSSGRFKGNLYKRLDVSEGDLGRVLSVDSAGELIKEAEEYDGTIMAPPPSLQQRKLNASELTTGGGHHYSGSSPNPAQPVTSRQQSSGPHHTTGASSSSHKRGPSSSDAINKKTLLSTWEEVDKLYGPVRTRGLLTSRKMELMKLATHHSGGSNNDNPSNAAQTATSNNNGRSSSSGKKSRGLKNKGGGGNIHLLSTATAADVLRSGAVEKEKDAAFEAMAPASWAKRFRGGTGHGKQQSQQQGAAALSKFGKLGAMSAMMQMGRPTTAPTPSPHHHHNNNNEPRSTTNSQRPPSPTLYRVYRDLPLDIISGSPPPSRPHSATSRNESATPTNNNNNNSNHHHHGHHSPVDGHDDEDDGSDDIVYNNSWGAPSQLDNRLLAGAGEADSGPFSKRPLAADTGRLGYGEAYLRTMYSPPPQSPSEALSHSSKSQYTRVFAPDVKPYHSSSHARGPRVSLASGATPIVSSDVYALKRAMSQLRKGRSY